MFYVGLVFPFQIFKLGWRNFSTPILILQARSTTANLAEVYFESLVKPVRRFFQNSRHIFPARLDPPVAELL